MTSTARNHIAALLLLAPVATAFVATPAVAQHRVVTAQPAIASLALNADHALAPGSTLRIDLNGTPRARFANATLGTSGILVTLREVSAGHYVGTHVVRRQDRIDPTQLVTARLTHGDRTVSRSFSFPAQFQAFAMGAAPVLHAAAIERFTVRAHGRIEPGRELRFRVVGAPGGEARVNIPGVVRGIPLEETRAGVYEGRYTVRGRDDPEAFSRAVATLSNDGLRSRAQVVLDEDGRFDRRERLVYAR